MFSFTKVRFLLLLVVTILSFICLFYSINPYSIYAPDSKFQLEYFALPSETISGAVLVIPQHVLEDGTILPLTLGNHSSGAAIILPQDILRQGAILPLYLNKSIDSIYPKNSSDNSIIIVPEKMLSGGIIDIRKGNMSSGAAVILPQDALDTGAVLSFKKGNGSEGSLIILTKEVLNNKQIIQLPQGGAILPITHANMSQGAIIILPSQIVEDRVLPLPQEKAILPITDVNTTDGAIIMLSNKSLDEGGTFQISEGVDIRSFLHGDNLLSIPDRGTLISSSTRELKDIDLLKSHSPILLPDNSLFIPKNALPFYLPNGSLLIENHTRISTKIPDNSIFVPNNGPLSILDKSQLIVKGNYGSSINLPDGSLIGSNGEILIPLPNVSLMLDHVAAPLPLPERSAILIGNGTGAPLPLPERSAILIGNGTGVPLPLPKGASLLIGGETGTVLPSPGGQTSGETGTVLPSPGGQTSGETGTILPSPGGQTSGETGTILPSPKVPLFIANETGTILPSPEKASLLIGNDTEFQNLVLNGSRIVNSSQGLFLIIPNSLGTIIVPSDGQIIKNLPQGAIIVPDDGQIINNLPQGAIIALKEVINNLPQGAIIIPDKDFIPFLEFDGKDYFLEFDGKNFIDAQHESKLQLQNFTLSVWFKTNKTDYIEPGHIVNKGGFNSEEEGKNMNYGIWMTNGSIIGGYETKLGESISVKSPKTYNDGEWHFAILINNGSTLRLEIDKQTVATKSTNGTIPDYAGAQPFRIGANSLEADKFFYGNIGEVNVWNRPLTSIEINKIYNNNNYSLNGLILYLKTGSTYTLTPPIGQTPGETGTILPSPESKAGLQMTPATTTNATSSLISPPPLSSTLTNEITPTTKEFNIAISSDWGCSKDTKETVKNLQDKNPELVIAGGDLSYEEFTGFCWIEEIIKPVATKTKIAFGDHDYVGIGENRKPKQDYLAHFNLIRTYYSFDHGNVHFLVMDPYTEYGINSNQFKFVQNDLQSASLNQSINWIFVVEHVPLYTSPAQHLADSTLRDIYHPIFDKYGVDLVFSGDNHNYQRTFPLTYNNSNPDSSNPIITDKNHTNYKGDYQGQIYLITGVGGRSLYELKGQAPFVSTQDDKHFGYIDINIKGNHLEGSFYSNQMSLNQGLNNYTIIDKFSISKDK